MEKASNVFVRNELIPLQKRIEQLNQWIGNTIINFYHILSKVKNSIWVHNVYAPSYYQLKIDELRIAGTSDGFRLAAGSINLRLLNA